MAELLSEDALRELVAETLRQHYIDHERHDPAQDMDHCRCGPLVEDWDDHWAEAVLHALTAASSPLVAHVRGQVAEQISRDLESPTDLSAERRHPAALRERRIAAAVARSHGTGGTGV